MAEENSEEIQLPQHVTAQLRTALDELLIQKNNGILSSASMGIFQELKAALDRNSDQSAS